MRVCVCVCEVDVEVGVRELAWIQSSMYLFVSLKQRLPHICSFLRQFSLSVCVCVCLCVCVCVCVCDAVTSTA